MVQEKNLFSKPKILTIKKIGIKSYVEQVGLDSKGRMDVPKKSDDVAWYQLGARPGDLGSAVIAGHLDKASGAPAVFWNLKKLMLGDRIEITDDNNKTLAFVVEKIQTYNDNNFPLREVFANTSEKRLNLITCSGAWDKNNKNYSQRLVVYASLESD